MSHSYASIHFPGKNQCGNYLYIVVGDAGDSDVVDHPNPAFDQCFPSRPPGPSRQQHSVDLKTARHCAATAAPETLGRRGGRDGPV